MKSCSSSWCREKEPRGLCILGMLAARLPWHTMPGLILTPAFSKKEKENTLPPSIHPSIPLVILQSRARKKCTAEKYPCWFWNLFCDVETWNIKSHHVSLNFINPVLSFSGWIFLSFEAQNTVLRNTGLGSTEEHCAKLNRWFWQDNLGRGSSFPAWIPLPWHTELQHRVHLVPCPHGASCSPPSCSPLQGMDGAVSDLPLPRNLVQFIGNLSMVASRKPAINSSGKVTGGACWIVLFCFA